MKKRSLLLTSYFSLAIGIILFVSCGILILRSDNRDAIADIVSAYEDYYNELEQGSESVYASASDAETDTAAYDIEEVEAESNDGAISLKDIDTIITIPSIDLSGPVYTGSDRMNYLDAFLFVTGYEDNRYGTGNYYIFGHQSRTYGKSFNRIKELDIGDEIIINKSGSIYTYCVTEMETTYVMEVEKSSEETDTLYIYTCEKSSEENKPYIRIMAKKQ